MRRTAISWPTCRALRLYRRQAGRGGVRLGRAAGGLAEIAALPLTDKAELRGGVTPDNPVGTHLCASPQEIVRIYSTSGTTGTPSYIPLTADDLDNWITGSARSYAASGVAAGQRIVSTYNAGPFVAGAALGLVRAHRPLPHSRRHRQHRAAVCGDPAAAAAGGGADPLVRRTPDRVGDRARHRPRRVERRARAGRRASRAAASRPSGGCSSRAGARESPRRWASVTSVCRCGGSARRRTACTWAREASSTRS